MLVGAPWDGPPNNRKGDVYKCSVGREKNSSCNKVNLGERNYELKKICSKQFMFGFVTSMLRCLSRSGETALQNVSKNLRNSHLGMTLTPTSPDGFLVCGINTAKRGFLFFLHGQWVDGWEPEGMWSDQVEFVQQNSDEFAPFECF